MDVNISGNFELCAICLEPVEKPFKPGRKTVQEWLNMVANHQFTIQEIEDGLAFDTLKVQYQNGG